MSKLREMADLINTVPASYTDSTIHEQPDRPVRGDLWFQGITRVVEREEIIPPNTPLRVITPSNFPTVIRKSRTQRNLKAIEAAKQQFLGKKPLKVVDAQPVKFRKLPRRK